MTVYNPSTPRPRWMRPTLRLRLTLLNGVLLVGVGVLFLLVSWVLVSSALEPAEDLTEGSRITLSDGRNVDAREYMAKVAKDTRFDLFLKGTAALVVVSAAGVAGAYLVATRSLRPLKRITTSAQRLSTETLDQRIRYAGPDDELKDLADTFDAMLDRLTKAFDSQKRFVANASHELRTPLAVMRTEIEVTLADPHADAEELRRMGRVVMAASERANDLVSALLLLARTEAQAGRRLARKKPADLVSGVKTALHAVRSEIGWLGLTVTTDLEPAPVVGDPSLLDRLAGNLIENGVRYNGAPGHLWARTGSDGTQSWLVVGNTGPTLDPVEIPALFEPFRRGGQERTGTRGAGLGLSIVRAVVDAHGGTVSARPVAGGGLEVAVVLPAASVTPLTRGAATAVGARHR